MKISLGSAGWLDAASIFIEANGSEDRNAGSLGLLAASLATIQA